MGLFSFFAKQHPKTDYYFALYLKDKSANGYIYLNDNNILTIVASEEYPYTNAWEEVVANIDQLLSTLESKIDAAVSKTIFFLPAHFIDRHNQEIKPIYKSIVKNIARNLELQPLGYIEIKDVVSEVLKNRDDSPLNAIIVELQESHLSLFVYKGDREVLASSVARSADLPDDIEEIIINSGQSGHFPARMIVYGNGAGDAVSLLAGYSWKSQIFVHPPKIELISNSELADGMKNIFANQLQQSIKTTHFSQDYLSEPTEESQILGFYIGQDIREIAKESVNDADEEVTHKFGPDQEVEERDSPTFLSTVLNLKEFLASFFSRGGSYRLLIIPLVLLILWVVVEYFFHQLDTTVYLPAQTINKSIDVLAAIDSKSSELTVRKELLNIELKEQIETSGQRDIGQKAKGSVIIHNFDNVVKTLNKGTKLTFGKLTFSIDQDINVASASAITSSGTKQSGKSKVLVTADEIGEEYNLEKGKELNIADLPVSLYVAIVDENFSGGTRKKVRTVAKKDTEELQENLVNKARAQAPSLIRQQLRTGENFLSSLVKVNISQLIYNQEVGEESSIVSAQGKFDITYYKYSETDLKKQIEQVIQSTVPAGFVMVPDRLSFTIEKAEDNNDETINLVVRFSNRIIRNIPQAEIIKDLKGKTRQQMETILKDKYEAVGFEIVKVSPPIPIFSAWTPIFAKNIKLKLSAK